MHKKGLWLAALLAVIIVASGLRGVSADAADGQAAEVLTLEDALQEAVDSGSAAVQARLSLQEALLEAADWQHEHEMGPPRGHSITLPTGEEEPATTTITLGEPSRLQKAQVEKLLPLKAEVSREAARAAYMQQMAALRAEAAEAYYDAVSAQREVQLQEDSLEVFEAHRDRAEALFEEGEVAELDVLQAEAQLTEQKATLRSAQQRLKQAVLSLNQLTGAELDRRVILPETGYGELPVRADIEEDIQRALAADAEIAGIRAGLQVAQKELDLFVQHHGSFSARRSYQKRYRAVKEAENKLHQAHREVEVRIRQLHSQLDDAAARVEALDEQVKLLRRAEEAALLRYQEGLAPVTELLDASVGVQEARLARLQAELSYLTIDAGRQALLGTVPESVEDEFLQVKQEIEQLR